MMFVEKSYGVIPVYKDAENLFLILLQQDSKADIWSFPKGHHENDELPQETALRELKEETGLSNIILSDIDPIREEYEFIRNDKNIFKINEYFIAFIENTDILIQEEEIVDYKWVTYEEALEIFSYKPRQETLKKAKELIDLYESGK